MTVGARFQATTSLDFRFVNEALTSHQTMTAEPGAVEDESHWGGIEETAEDPEEVRVIFSALDSFLSV